MLPFLVVHGPIVWKVALGVLVAMAVVIVRGGVRRRERRRIRFRESLRLQRGGANQLRAGRVALKGVFRGCARSVKARDGAVVDTVDGPAWLELEQGTRVLLEGSLRVLFGTRARVWLVGRRRRVDEVRDGDVVTARGVATYGAAETEGDYRESAGRWTMRADAPRGEPVTIVAAEPAIRTRAMTPVLVVTTVLVGAAGYAAVQRITFHPQAPESTDAETAVSTLSEVSIAAVFPRSRSLALNKLDELLSHQLDRSSARDTMRDELDDLISTRCEDSKKAMHRLEDGRYEAALAAARTCADDTDVARLSLVWLARYDEALALGAPEHDEAPGALIAALATWHPNRVELAQRATAWAGVPAKGTYDCLAEWLAQNPQLELPSDCDPESEYRVPADTRFLVELVMGPGTNAWLVQFADPSGMDDRRRMHVVATAIVRGDFGNAATAATAIRDPDLARVAKRAIQLRTGTPEIGDPDGVEHPRRSFTPPAERECRFVEAIRSAWSDGDGAPIAAVVRTHPCRLDVDLEIVSRLLDVLPHLTKGKDELAEAVRLHPSFYDTSQLPASIAAEASLRRDLARLLGDRAEMERQDAIVQRAVAALSTRARVLAFRQLESAEYAATPR